MKRKKRRASMPVLLCWSKKEQARFIEAIDRLYWLIDDLESKLDIEERKRVSRAYPGRTANGGAK